MRNYDFRIFDTVQPESGELGAAPAWSRWDQRPDFHKNASRAPPGAVKLAGSGHPKIKMENTKSPKGFRFLFKTEST